MPRSRRRRCTLARVALSCSRPTACARRCGSGARHGGNDGVDGRSLRYLEWTTDPDPADTTYDVDFVLMLREPGKPLRVEHDHHVFGVFPTATWERLLGDAGLELVDAELDDPWAGEHALFVTRRV